MIALKIDFEQSLQPGPISGFSWAGCKKLSLLLLQGLHEGELLLILSWTLVLYSSLLYSWINNTDKMAEDSGTIFPVWNNKCDDFFFLGIMIVMVFL